VTTPPALARSPSPRLRVGLVGAGIAASRTPAMHMAEGAAQGLDYRYDLIDTDAPELAGQPLHQVLRGLEAQGYAGVNVTYPHKRAAMALCDFRADSATAVGATNTIVFTDDGWIAHNTDYSGFAESFRQGAGRHARGCALLFGAGGAGGAVANALLDSGVGLLFVHDTDAAASAALTAALTARLGPGRARPAGELRVAAAAADVIVNATPVGMVKLPGLPLDPALLEPRHLVAEIVYFPLETALLRAARNRGCATIDGSGMAVFQAVAAFALFTGRTPDPQRMRATFETFA